MNGCKLKCEEWKVKEIGITRQRKREVVRKMKCINGTHGDKLTGSAELIQK